MLFYGGIESLICKFFLNYGIKFVDFDVGVEEDVLCVVAEEVMKLGEVLVIYCEILINLINDLVDLGVVGCVVDMIGVV